MGKTSFQPLDQLIQDILKDVELMNHGRLTLDGIDQLTEQSRDLYERLIVIRHKAFEQLAKNENSETIIESQVVEEVKPKKQKAEESSLSFDFSEPVEETASEETAPAFEPTLIADIIEDEPETSEEVMEATPDSVTMVDSESTNEIETDEPKDLNESFKSDSHSINDIFKSSDASLADRLSQSSINDIKNHIDINKKFSYISKLFGGDNEAYNQNINVLNQCQDGDEARYLLEQLSNTYQWDVEDNTVVEFVQLVERRYL